MSSTADSSTPTPPGGSCTDSGSPPNTPTGPAAVGFLTWLADRRITLADVGQGDVEDYLTGVPPRYHVRDFLQWAPRPPPKTDTPTCHRPTMRFHLSIDPDELAGTVITQLQ